MTLRKWTKGALCAASIAAMTALGVTGASAQTTPDDLAMVADSWIFVFRDNIAPGQVRSLADQAAASAGGQRGHVYTATIKGFSAKMSATAAARLAANNPNIAYYEADKIARIVAPPSSKAKPGGGTPPPQTTPWGITRVNGVVSFTGANRAWVIDTGIDLDHPDLNVDVARSKSFLGGNQANNPDDQNGHGSHVAGTIAAINNTIGVIGVAPGAPVVAVRVLDRRGSGTFSGVIAGVDYVAANGAPGDVANMSLGGGFSQALNDAVIAASANVKFAVAAGNESTDASTKSPASANGPNVFTISAFSEGDVFASFSNFGNPPVDFADPGVSVFSTYKDAGYATLSGTSMATPHAAGVLLLGACRSGGTVSGDPDGNPDTICIH